MGMPICFLLTYSLSFYHLVRITCLMLSCYKFGQLCTCDKFGQLCMHMHVNIIYTILVNIYYKGEKRTQKDRKVQKTTRNILKRLNKQVL